MSDQTVTEPDATQGLAPVLEDDDPDLKGLSEAMAGSGDDDPLTRPRTFYGDGAPEPIGDEGPLDTEDDLLPPEITATLDETLGEADDPEVDPTAEEEILEPKIAAVGRVLTDSHMKKISEGQFVSEPRSRTYVQKEISFFGKLELYGLFGRAIDTAMSGANALSVDDIVSSMNPRALFDLMQEDLPGAETSPDAEDKGVEREGAQAMAQAGKVLATFARILSFAPDMLKEVYCVILAVPKGHRKWAIEQAFDNMEDEVGEDILHTFIDQNWPVMQDFFRKRLPQLLKRAKQAQERHAA